LVFQQAFLKSHKPSNIIWQLFVAEEDRYIVETTFVSSSQRRLHNCNNHS